MSIRHAILALLERQPMYGYELKHEFETEIGRHWSLNFGQIYLTLESLEKQGAVKHKVVPGADAPDRKVFSITAKGRKDLAAWFKSPIEPVKGLRDEFYLKFTLALASASAEVEDLVLSQKKFVLQKLHEYTALKRRADPALDLNWIMLLDLALLRAEADIRWLEMCEARLKKLQKGGPKKGRRAARPPARPAPSPEISPEPAAVKEE